MLSFANMPIDRWLQLNGSYVLFLCPLFIVCVILGTSFLENTPKTAIFSIVQHIATLTDSIRRPYQKFYIDIFTTTSNLHISCIIFLYFRLLSA